jgi:lipopolysaccharide/colanic/teichoic acid biosynthesis glycosyltransferase
MMTFFVPRPPPLFRPETVNRRVTVMRAVDVSIAAVGLIVLAPLLVLVAAAILVDGRGPIIFSQLRLGIHGQHFRLYKFRKFDEGRRVRGGGPLTMNNDPRLTRLGRLLAWTKLDELPQLWNVLRGDMAIVGPRPESLDFADCFDDGHRWALDHRPGIFGPTQVFFRNEGSLFQNQKVRDLEQFYRDVLFPLKARIDRAYYPERTFFRDITWIVRGTFAVFGWTPSLHEGSDLAGEVENWIRCNLSTRRGHLEETVEVKLVDRIQSAPLQPKR